MESNDRCKNKDIANDMFIAKAVLYFLRNYKGEYCLTITKLKFLCILYIRKFNEKFNTNHSELSGDDFNLLLYKLKFGDFIDISEPVLMNKHVWTKVELTKEWYSSDEWAMLNLILDTYADVPSLYLYDTVYNIKKK